MRVKEESQWREKEKGFLEHIKVASNSRVAKQGLGSIVGAVRTLAMFMVDFLFYFILFYFYFEYGAPTSDGSSLSGRV